MNMRWNYLRVWYAKQSPLGQVGPYGTDGKIARTAVTSGKHPLAQPILQRPNSGANGGLGHV